MAKARVSTKRLMIDKANARMVGTVAAASFITVFSLISLKALYSQMSYQNRVITGKEKAVKTLKTNIDNAKTLVTTYKTFNAAPSLLGTTDNNAKIVLDALPSKYDFPALTSSLEKILIAGGYHIESITGTDDEANQLVAGGAAAPVPIPFAVTATASYQSVQKLVADLDRSIRPFTIKTVNLSGNDANIRIDVQAETYYQPEKTVQITTKVVK